MFPPDWKEGLVSPADFYGQLFELKPGSKTNSLVKCCFHSDSRPSLSINLESGKYCCFSCGAKGGDVIDFYQAFHGVGFRDAVECLSSNRFDCLPGPVIQRPKTQSMDISRLLKRIWKEGQPISKGDPVDLYLSGRCIRLPEYPSVLRYHPNLQYTHEDDTKTFHPAMIAAMVGDNGKLVGLHRTYLTEYGSKADLSKSKRFLGSVGTIRLMKPTNELAVAEGIETAISYRLLANIPAWSCSSSRNLEKFEPPEGVSTVFICVDLDRSETGIKTANSLASRLIRKRIEVRIAKPPLKGSGDWNDYLKRITT